MTAWLVVIAIGLLTFGLRLSFIQFVGDRALPDWLRRALRLVPAAVLSAIIVPALLLPAGRLDLAPTNARLIMGVVAVLVAWRTRNALLTVAVGMAGLWLLNAVLR